MIRIHTLGGAAIDIGNNRITPISTRKFALLLHVGAEAGRRVSRSVLCDLIYPDRTAASAMHCLREHVYQFRQVGIPLNADSDTVQIARHDVRLDYDDILASERPTRDQLKAVESGFLPGYAPDHSEAFTEWLDAYRARITFKLCKRLLGDVSRARLIGDSQTTERAARACLALDMLNEEATLALAEVLAIGGAKAKAVNLLDHYLREVAYSSHDLKISATVLRRRIGERLPAPYASKLMSPFVGRGQQVIELRERFQKATAGDSQCVALIGEVGIGKTRLSSEFSSIAVLEGAGVATTVCQPNDTHRPFGAFADLVPRLMEMRGALGCAPASLKAIERLTKRRSDESISFEEAIRDSEALCDSIAHALVDVIDAIASEQPLVLAIENIHWADSMSARVIASLLTRRRSRRVLVLLTSREAGAVQAVSRYTEIVTIIELRGLDADSIGRLTSELANQHEVQIDAEMHRWLEDTSAGNPLFLESLVSHYVTTNERFAVSPTLSRLLAARIGALQSRSVVTLQASALLGKHSTLDTIIKATDLPRFELLHAISELECARLIVARGPFVTPSHAMVGEVALSKLSLIQGCLAHRSVAEALESLVEEDSTAVLWECADHWVAARETTNAVRSLRRCAERAVEIGRPGEAAEALSKILNLDVGAAIRVSTARAMAFAADAADNPLLALRAIDILDRNAPGDHHDDFEFVRFRTLSRSLLAGEQHANRLLYCVNDANADSPHRVIAATLLLKYADLSGDGSLASAALKSLPSSVLARVEEHQRLEFLVLQAIVQKDWDSVGLVARRLMEAATGAPIATRLALQCNAALALHKAGFTAEAIGATVSVYHDAEQVGHRCVRARASRYLADTFLNLGDVQNEALWSDRAQQAHDEAHGSIDDFYIGGTMLYRACTLGQVAEARRLLLRGDAAGWFTGSLSRLRFRRAMAAWLGQISGSGAPSAADLKLLTAGVLENTSSNAIRDIEAAVVCRSLLEDGRIDEAKTIYDQFVNTSRHGLAVRSRCLQDVAVRLLDAAEQQTPAR